jgi:hypothetical protein
VNSIEIRFMVSQTLWLRIYGRVVVYRPLVPHNRVRASNLQSSKWLYDNKLKLRWPSLLLIQNDLMLRLPNLGDYMWRCCQTSMVHMVHLVAHSVSTKICLFLLILQLLTSKWIVFKMIILKFVINIWFLF